MVSKALLAARTCLKSGVKRGVEHRVNRNLGQICDSHTG